MYRMQRLSALVVALVLGLSSASTFAADIATWNTSGLAGNEATLSGTGAANISGATISRGSGLNAASSANTFSSNSWNSTAASPATDTEYFSLSFTIASGYAVDLADLKIHTQSSSTGPGTLGLYYSGDGFTTSLYTFTEDTTATNNFIDLSSLPSLTGTVEFRIIQIGNLRPDGTADTGSTGTFKLTNYTASPTGPIAFQGAINAVSAVPTPAAMPAGLALLGVLGLKRNRKRA